VGRPAALTITVLRPDLFRIVVESPPGSPAAGLPRSPAAGLSGSPAAGLSGRGTEDSFSGTWTHALQDWEP
jgi:hypothetical protein